MKKFLYPAIRKFLFFLLTCIARILPGLKPSKTQPVLPAQSLPVFLPVNINTLPDKFAKRFFVKKKVGERHLSFFKNVYVNGDAVIFKNLRVFRPSLATEKNLFWYKSGRFLVRQWLFKVTKIANDETVALVYDQWGYENYYHWMIESLPRLLIIQKKYPDCLIILPEPTPEFIKTTVVLMGFKKLVYLHTKEMVLLKAKNLVTPNLVFEQAEEYFTVPLNKSQRSKPHHFKNLFPWGAFEEELIVSVRRQLLSHFKPVNSGKRIFVSRSLQSQRKLVNETEIESILLKYRFEIIYFEKMSFSEQVTLMQQTSVLLSLHGANLVNILFLPPSAIVIEMMNEDFLNDLYFILASSLTLSYYSVPCTMTDTSLKPPKDVVVLYDAAKPTDEMIDLNNADLKVNTLLLDQTLEIALHNLF